jgi:hypothetical protein
LIWVILGAWLVAALGAGRAGLVAGLRPPLPQLLILGLVAVMAVAYFFVKSWQEALDTFPVRVLISFHSSRLVGIYFLILFRQGVLPGEFAVPAGCGDILVAILAIALVVAGGPKSSKPPTLHRIWNLLGLADILFVVFTAARLALRDPASMAPLLRLPLGLLPTFLVPLIIFSHLLIALRLNRRATSTSPRYS